MKQQSAFAIRKFKNQSGLLSWRIEGRLHGLRIRKNFLGREEAAAEKTAMEMKALHVAAGMRSATTFLTDTQLREAEEAYRRVDGRASPLLAYLDFALANYRERDQLKPLDEAIAEYYATKKTAYERTLLSVRQLRSIENELGALKGCFPKA